MAAVLFDMGDTLAASQYLLDRELQAAVMEDAAAVWPDGYPQTAYNIWRPADVAALFRDSGVPYDALAIEDLAAATGPNTDAETLTAADRVSAGKGTLDDVARLVVDRYRQREERFLADSGVFSMLDGLQDRFDEVGILTNNTYEGGEIYREMFDRRLDRPLAVVVSSGHRQVRAEKPAWKPFGAAARQLDSAPGETVYVGNKEEGDIYGAARAGMQPLGARFYRNTLSGDGYPTIGEELSPDELSGMDWTDYDVAGAARSALDR